MTQGNGRATTRRSTTHAPRTGSRGAARATARRTTYGNARAERTLAGTRARHAATPSRPPRRHRGWKIFGIVVGVFLVGGCIGGIVGYNLLKKSLPDLDIRNAKGRDQTSTILDRNGVVLATLYADQNRKDVPLAKMPTALRQAVVATEDRRFYEHSGVDPIGIMRALVTDVRQGRNAQGGSTITQQYIKQAFVGSQKTITRKFQEAIMARELDRRYSKDEILALYLNTIYFGHSAYGVESAAQVYFGKDVSQLTLPECALLAGIIKSPGSYSPYLDPAAARARRDTVLGLMRAQNVITAAQYEQARNTPITTAGLKKARTKAPYFVEWVKSQMLAKYGEAKLYRGGLTIRTTLDYSAERRAEKVIAEKLNRSGDPSAALVSIDPATGQIIAMVGGRDFDTQQYNVAAQGRRQPGSAFKTFVLAAALKEGISPEKVYPTAAHTFQTDSGPWKVSGHRGGPKTLRASTALSINSVFARVILDIGPAKVVSMAQKLGITTPVDPVPAIALGGLTTGVSPLEMASAYATLAAGGTYAKPYGIVSVTEHDGTVLEKHAPKLTPKAINPAIAYLTTDVLKGVLKNGTGTAARLGRPAAGKTGTTQAYRDAWFCGYTPTLSTAVWVGYPSAQKEMKSVHGITVTGGTFPARIWGAYMKEELATVKATDFVRPDGFKAYTICTETGQLATPYCPSTKTIYSLDGAEPTPCTKHKAPKSTTPTATKKSTGTGGD